MDGLIFLYLAIFPFGKLSGNLTDIAVMLICIFWILSFRPKWRNPSGFLVIYIFSLFFSLSFFKLSEVFIGLLYLIRLISYVILSQIIFKRFGHIQKRKKLIFNSLILVGLFMLTFIYSDPIHLSWITCSLTYRERCSNCN